MRGRHAKNACLLLFAYDTAVMGVGPLGGGPGAFVQKVHSQHRNFCVFEVGHPPKSPPYGVLARVRLGMGHAL